MSNNNDDITFFCKLKPKKEGKGVKNTDFRRKQRQRFCEKSDRGTLGWRNGSNIENTLLAGATNPLVGKCTTT